MLDQNFNADIAHQLSDLELIELISNVSSKYYNLVYRPRTKEEFMHCKKNFLTLMDEICNRKESAYFKE